MEKNNTGIDMLDRHDTNLKNKKPNMYKVILLNDDFTPMDFVVSLLEKVFNKGYEEAISIMLEVHNKGKGIAGIYTLEIAEQKAIDTFNLARKAKHPLQCIIERE
jgi:ATP-dependent Clp protease adaptor protein ClpS